MLILTVTGALGIEWYYCYVFVGIIFLMTMGQSFYRYKIYRDNVDKIKRCLDHENTNKWNARFIHWKVQPHLHFIHIMFNFNSQTGVYFNQVIQMVG